MRSMSSRNARVLGRGSALSWIVDAGVAAALVLVFWFGHLGSTGDHRLFLLGLGLAAVVAVSLVFRWKLPVLSPVVALLATGAGWMLGVSSDPMFGAAWCLYPLSLRRGARTHWVGLAVAGTTVLFAASVGSGSSSVLDQRITLAAMAFGTVWLLGHVEAKRQEAVQDAMRQAAQTERAHEQNAMARDVHDVVGHALSVISAEADVTRHLPHLQEADLRKSLGDIEQRARAALEEVQALVRALRIGETGSETAPSLSQLVADARVSGLDIETKIDFPDVDEKARIVATRVVQEALSNVIRHSDAHRCEVAVWQEDGDLVIRIDDDGSGLIQTGQSGMGLTGMRERVEGVGGSLNVTTRLEGGTRVLATMPVKMVS